VPAPWSRVLEELPVRFTPRPVAQAPTPSPAPQAAAPAATTPVTHRSTASSGPKPKPGLWSKFLAWTRGE